MATFRNLAISLRRLVGAVNIARAMTSRQHPTRPLQFLMIT
jgi:hypothetical protein